MIAKQAHALGPDRKLVPVYWEHSMASHYVVVFDDQITMHFIERGSAERCITALTLAYGYGVQHAVKAKQHA